MLTPSNSPVTKTQQDKDKPRLQNLARVLALIVLPYDVKHDKSEINRRSVLAPAWIVALKVRAPQHMVA